MVSFTDVRTLSRRKRVNTNDLYCNSHGKKLKKPKPCALTPTQKKENILSVFPWKLKAKLS